MTTSYSITRRIYPPPSSSKPWILYSHFSSKGYFLLRAYLHLQRVRVVHSCGYRMWVITVSVQLLHACSCWSHPAFICWRNAGTSVPVPRRQLVSSENRGESFLNESYFLGKTLKLMPPDALIQLKMCLVAGLRPRPRWGSLQRSSDPLAGFKGLLLKG